MGLTLPSEHSWAYASPVRFFFFRNWMCTIFDRSWQKRKTRYVFYQHEDFTRNKPPPCSQNRMEKGNPIVRTEKEEEESDVLSFPAWVPEESRALLEPTPIITSASGRPTLSQQAVDRLEEFFQWNIVLQHALMERRQHETGKHLPEDNNALQRIIDQLIDVGEPSVGGCTPDTFTASAKTVRTPRYAAFPNKLHDMLEYCEKKHLQHLACWEMGGKAFRINSIDEFQSVIIRKFFKLTKFGSFQRQLNLYSFSRIPRGP